MPVLYSPQGKCPIGPRLTSTTTPARLDTPTRYYSARPRTSKGSSSMERYWSAGGVPWRRVSAKVKQRIAEEDNTPWNNAFTVDFSANNEDDVQTLPDGRSRGQGLDNQAQAVSDRDYLNGLVEASVANTDNQKVDIAFVKTHKTGSTTMGSLLRRYAFRHGVKLAKFNKLTVVDLKLAVEQVENGEFESVNIMHYHISSQGHLKGSWPAARKKYVRIMRNSDDVNFITVLREPRSHFISYYYYYLNPSNKLSLEDFLTKPRHHRDRFAALVNPLASEFGVTTLTQMERLIAHELSSFKLIFLTERFDEGLMVLRRLLGWGMIDMTYITLNETKPGVKRWDGKTFVDKPTFDDLPEKVQKKIDELTMLDQLLYTAAQEEYAKRLQPMSNVIEADLEEFNQLQDVVSDYLNANDSSKANALYRLEDVYEDSPPVNPF